MATTSPTITDVARLAAVSTATVSNVVNGSAKVAPATRERVLKAIEALGYSPHPAARHMRGGSSHLLGLIVADIMNPFFTELVQWVERAANASGYSVLLCNSDEDLQREQQHLKLLRSQRVDGILLAATVIAVVTSRGECDQVALRAFLRQRLSAYKVPKVIIETSAMPLTSYGKVDKKALRASINAPS